MNPTLLFLCLALVQSVFLAWQSFGVRRREYQFYFIYTICVMVFIAGKTFPGYNPISFLVIEGEPFTAARSVLMIGYAMYYRFGCYFVEAPRLYPTMNRVCRIAEIVLLTFGVTDITLLLCGVHFQVLEPVSQTIYLSMIPVSLYLLYFLITRKRRLTGIFVIGSSLLLLFASAAFISQVFIDHGARPQSFYAGIIQIGIALEFLFLNYGLVYKGKILQRSNSPFDVEREVELYRPA